eukprot:2404281-Alexandrium_andersonii.AAC.1
MAGGRRQVVSFTPGTALPLLGGLPLVRCCSHSHAHGDESSRGPQRRPDPVNLSVRPHPSALS